MLKIQYIRRVFIFLYFNYCQVIVMVWTGYSNPEEARREIGLKPGDVEDTDLEPFLDRAQREVLDQIAIYQFDEVTTGACDGSNTTFQLKHYPIADSNFDKLINTLDVELYKWGDTSEIETRETVSMSTLYPDHGIAIVSSAPASTYDVVVANYWYYPRHIKLNRIHKAVALLAGYYYVRSELLLLPSRWAQGAYRFERGTPSEDLLKEYYRVLDNVIGRGHAKDKHGDITFSRDE